MKNFKKKQFTLMELLVVFVIIALLASFAGPKILGKLKGAKVSTAKQQTRLFRSTVEQYYLDQNKYPDSLEALLEKNSMGDRYFSEKYIPKDPWDNDYIYSKPGSDDEPFDVISLGQDGSAGGTGVNSDISCWDDPNKKKD
ncbi:MAG: type II secretion system major pseudopilin GspG [Lentisphaeria bacterium]|nr:type II secretion system major pseudopilin GspG [Lentisphaeria bacterium]